MRQKRLEADGTGWKRSWVKYEDGIDRVKDNLLWKEWISLESSANKTLLFHGHLFWKDAPNDSEKLMMWIIDCMNAHERAQDKKKDQEAAKILVSMNRGVTIGNTLICHSVAENEEARGERAMWERSKGKDLDDYRAEDERAEVDKVKEDFVIKGKDKGKKARAEEDKRSLKKKRYMMRKLSVEGEGIIKSHESDLGHIRRGECLGMIDISGFMDFLKQWNDDVCKENGSTQSLFYKFEFIKINKNHESQCYESSGGIIAKRDDIVEM